MAIIQWLPGQCNDTRGQISAWKFPRLYLYIIGTWSVRGVSNPSSDRRQKLLHFERFLIFDCIHCIRNANYDWHLLATVLLAHCAILPPCTTFLLHNVIYFVNYKHYIVCHTPCTTHLALLFYCIMCHTPCTTHRVRLGKRRGGGAFCFVVY